VNNDNIIEIMNILRFLQLPYMNTVENLDDPKVTTLRRKIIEEKIFLKKLYTDFYIIFKNSLRDLPKEIKLVELGSGGGFIKKIIPDVITSDVITLPDVDLNFSATKMPFKNESVDRFFMLNVLHHINDSRLFFKEAYRCLKNNGKIIMIEPANTLWGGFFYQHFHHEGFNSKTGWILESHGPLSDANNALPWIIFIRDKNKFEKLFPNLKIIRIVPHTPIRFIISGGVTFRQLLPSWTYSIIKGIEKLASPFSKYTGMFYTIEIEKVA